ncbi:ATP-grasp fold amidoligase family protein [Turicibacter sanguinis]|uniref:ATP-grasp fold amidoligase family protein n=1 Tax=Turicibacter sanguinis TaxID=154288 RepID=UPI0032EC0F79
MVNRIIKGFKNPKRVVLYLLNINICKIIPDKLFLRLKYRLRIEKKLDLDNPKSFNEKIQWLKINDRKSEYTIMSDKYKVRDYISDKIGQEYLIPLLGCYDCYEEIDFTILPKKFVLKANHTSGDVFICTDKEKIDHATLRKTLNRWLKRDYYSIHREWPYKNIEPKIICEEFLEDSLTDDIKDYKFMCFNGEPKLILLCQNRQSKKGLEIDFYDIEWNLLDLKREKTPCSNNYSNKPVNYELMKDLAKRLSENIPFVRVDFYEVNNKLYFGEMTFYPAAGFEKFNPEIYDNILGDWIDISTIEKEIKK